MERVGVVPRDLPQRLGLLGTGFMPLASASALTQLEQALAFMDRGPAEDDPTHKQIIPYAVVCQGPAVLVVERLRGGAEARLHGKISIGIGGHVNPSSDVAGRDHDGDVEGPIRGTLRRELDEELVLSGVERIEPKGFLNDDSQPVGRVHLGVVFRVDLATHGAAQVRETHALAGGFRPWSELAALRPRMESWSAFVLDAYERGLLG